MVSIYVISYNCLRLIFLRTFHFVHGHVFGNLLGRLYVATKMIVWDIMRRGHNKYVDKD